MSRRSPAWAGGCSRQATRWRWPHTAGSPISCECGLEHRALPGDPLELVRARTAAPSPEAARSVFAAFLDELGEGVTAAAAAGTDVLLTAFGPAPLSRLVAEGLGIPSVGVYLAPGVPTREFPPPGWPVTGQLSPADNIAAGRELLARTGSLYADVLPRLRARLDLPPITAEVPSPPDGWPICHGFSPAVVPRPADWPATVHVTGYWWPAGPPGWRPPDLLADFLGAGPPPVFVGFGSMTPNPERLHDVVAAAVARAGVRAVVQSGWAELDRAELSWAGDDILLVGDLPHDWLFPGRPPWSTTPEQAPPGPGCVPGYRRLRCPSWSTKPSGRTGCTASVLRRAHCPCTS
jgi:UDP:flavonoid glycosyltransferase YjiC (YdhE family)